MKSKERSDIYLTMKNNGLVIFLWLLYFFLVCVNMSSPDDLRKISYDSFNRIVITILNLVTFAAILKNASFISKSKLLIFSELFLISYYVSILFNRPYYDKVAIWGPMVAFNAFIIARILSNNEEGIKKLLLSLSSVLSFIGLVSIDIASCRFISAYLGLLMKLFTGLNFVSIVMVEKGERIKSIISNPNIFASFMAVAIFINLYLFERVKHKKFIMAMLLIDIVAFLYAFSLGAILTLIFAFFLYFILNFKNNLLEKFFLVCTTLVISIICVVIGINGIGTTGYISYIPLVAIFVGYVCMSIIFEQRENIINSKVLKIFGIGGICGAIITVILALTLVDKVEFGPNMSEKAISVRLGAGGYNLRLEFDKNVLPNVVVQGQTFEQASAREYDILYDESLEGNILNVLFKTKENNKAIKIIINLEDTANLLGAKLYDMDDKLVKNININYLLIPDFVENRLSPFNSNQNALQRFIFFADGLKIWKMQPIIGKGPGAFYIYVNLVKTTEYTTWSSHNFLIDTLCDSGIIGAVALLSLLLYAFFIIYKNRKNELLITLGIILVFMVTHSLIEINFIYPPYMMTLGLVLGLISGGAGEEGGKILKSVNLVSIVILSLINIVVNFI